MQAKYELDRQLEELAHQERLDEEDEQRMLAFEAENERRRVEWEKEKAARRFADELARLEADVASLPPSAPARQHEVTTSSDAHAVKDGSGSGKPSKKRTAVDAGLQHAAAAGL